MNHPKNLKTGSIKSTKSSTSTSTRSSQISIISGPPSGASPSEIRPGSSDRPRAQHQWRDTVTFGGTARGPLPDNSPPASRPFSSEHKHQHAPVTLREQASKSSIRTTSSGASVRTVASENNGVTALTHPAQGAKNAVAARAKELSEERWRVENAKRQRERDESRERVEKVRLEAQMVHARRDPDQDWFVKEAEKVSYERSKDRGKRMRPEDRQRQ